MTKEVSEYAICKKCLKFTIPKPSPNKSGLFYLKCPECGNQYSESELTFVSGDKLTRSRMLPSRWPDFITFFVITWVVMTFIVLGLSFIPWLTIWNFIASIVLGIGHFLMVVALAIFDIMASLYSLIASGVTIILGFVFFKDDIIYWMERYKAYRLQLKELKELTVRNREDYDSLKRNKLGDEETVRPFIQNQNSLNRGE